MAPTSDVNGRTLLWTIVLMFIAAVLVARALLSATEAPVAFIVGFPLLFVLLLWRFRLVLGLILMAFFVTAVLGVRFVLQTSILGVVPLMILPFLMLAVFIAIRVVKKMRAPAGFVLDATDAEE